LEYEDIIAYTDSTLVLGRVNSQPYKYNTFVANRISKIQETIPSGKWGFVKGSENPADSASRGINAQEFKGFVKDSLRIQEKDSLWWNGPTWLSEEPPEPRPCPTLEEQMEEKKQTKVCHLTLSKPF
jgi:hypothetical protein